MTVDVGAAHVVPDRTANVVDGVGDEVTAMFTEAVAAFGADKASVQASPYRAFATDLLAMARVAKRTMENEQASASSPGKDAAAHASNNTKPPTTGKGRHGYVNA